MPDHIEDQGVSIPDRPHSWYSDLPELDDRSRKIVLEMILDVLVYRDVRRADVRDAFELATREAHKSGF